MGKKCAECKEKLGDIYYTNTKTKKSYHFSLSGKDCLQKAIDKEKDDNYEYIRE